MVDMNFYGVYVVLILASLFCTITGRVVQEGSQSARAVKAGGISGKGLLVQQLCKNDPALENNVIICLACRGFSRLCFSMASPAPGSSPSTGTKPGSSSGGSSSSTPASNSPGEAGGGGESGKSI